MTRSTKPKANSKRTTPKLNKSRAANSKPAETHSRSDKLKANKLNPKSAKSSSRSGDLQGKRENESAGLLDGLESEGPLVEGEKLQKVLARAGLGSRREMEKVIAEGAVTVNGEIALLGDRVNDADAIEVNGHRIRNTAKADQDLRVILYNKPEGQICSKSDPEGRPTVYENLPRLTNGRWVSVGRLDFNTSGLLLFTNNGELANTLMHPSSNIDREYLVRIQGEVDDDMLKRLRAGVELDDGVAKFTDIKAGSSEGSNWWFYCVVMEGRNREVRRLWESQGVRVSRLKRVRYGNIFIPSHVRVGQWIELDEKEMADLHLTVGLEAPRKNRFSNKGAETKERHQRKLRGSRAGIANKNSAPKRANRFSSNPEHTRTLKPGIKHKTKR